MEVERYGDWKRCLFLLGGGRVTTLGMVSCNKLFCLLEVSVASSLYVYLCLKKEERVNGAMKKETVLLHFCPLSMRKPLFTNEDRSLVLGLRLKSTWHTVKVISRWKKKWMNKGDNNLMYCHYKSSRCFCWREGGGGRLLFLDQEHWPCNRPIQTASSTHGECVVCF